MLTQIAKEAHVSNWSDLRWFAVGGTNPRSIVIVTRGKNTRTVLTISKTQNAEAWASWQPVLAELQTRKAQTNAKRIPHKDLPTGKMKG